MSRRPIALSPDLRRLQNEGYDLEIRGGYLLVKDVPYVDFQCRIKRGTLISRLELAGDITNKPTDHVAYWTGDHPCHSDGGKITAIENPSVSQNFGEGIQADFTFSAKADYRDYHHKITAYIGRIAGEAAKLDPDASACTFPVIEADADDGVFHYIDTASSRAGIGAVNDRLAGQRIGIVANGGTGSYILDFVAKTNVAEIHTFDGDVFSQHNAFRSPGAPTLEQLRAKPQKVSHFAAIYSNMRKGIIAHDCYLSEDNVALLDGLDFVFLCLDRGAAKRLVVDRLVANGTPFVEVGMGVLLRDGQLSGIVRVTTSTPDNRDKAAPHISYGSDVDVANDYATNIQIAELNAMNAALAVIQWKKLMGVYRDMRDEHYCGYSIATGEIVGEGTK
jgi:ThiF family